MSRVNIDAGLPEVAIAEVGGVKIRRHQLDLEARTMAHLARRIGMRLRRWLVSTELPVDAPGEKVRAEPLPDDTTIRLMDWYSRAVLGLLKEQRERAKQAGKGAPVMTDEEFALEDAKIRDEIRNALSVAELERLLEERKGALATFDGVASGGGDEP